MHRELQNGQQVAICAIAGMGGIGKTELATQYTKLHQADYPGGICWLNARESNPAAEFVQFVQLQMSLEVPQQLAGKPLNIQQQVAWCWQHWQPSAGLVLVVLDDVISLGSCRDVLPTNQRFRVLMTTRLGNLDGNFFELSLNVLSPAEAVELLTRLVGKRVVKAHSDATQLCEWLGYLPLGMELVGRYLAEDPDLSLMEMLQRLKEQRLQDEAIDRNEAQMRETLSTAQRAVKAAFELSWRELDSLTQDIAQMLSLFALDVIPLTLVESVCELLHWTKADINQGKKQLYKRHLIQQAEERERCYKIHPLIRQFLQGKLAESEQAQEVKRAFAEVMVAIAKTIPDSPTLEVIASVQDAIPHLKEVAQTLMLVQKLEDVVLGEEDLVWSFIGLGIFYKGQGLYALAEPWLWQCLELTQRNLGANHPDVASSLNNLAFLYKSQGRYEEAEPLFCQALELGERVLGVNHPHTVIFRKNLQMLRDSQAE